MSEQAADGAWRSSTYGALDDGWALTATCTKVLLFAPQGERGQRAAQRGLEFLAAAVGLSGELDSARLRLAYPVYTAALSVVPFARAAPDDPELWRAPREAWLRYLGTQQLTEQQGWAPADPAFGLELRARGPPRRCAARLRVRSTN